MNFSPLLPGLDIINQSIAKINKRTGTNHARIFRNLFTIGGRQRASINMDASLMILFKLWNRIVKVMIPIWSQWEVQINMSGSYLYRFSSSSYLGPSRRVPQRKPLHRHPPSDEADPCGKGSEWIRSGAVSGRKRIHYRLKCICKQRIWCSSIYVCCSLTYHKSPACPCWWRSHVA